MERSLHLLVALLLHPQLQVQNLCPHVGTLQENCAHHLAQVRRQHSVH